MGKLSKIVIVIIISLILVAFFLGIYITVDEEIPNNAVVVVTLEDKHYHSIHFDYIAVAGKTAKTMLLSEARAQGYEADQHSRNLAYFKGNRLFLYQYILKNFGIQYNSRWDKSGNWLW